MRDREADFQLILCGSGISPQILTQPPRPLSSGTARCAVAEPLHGHPVCSPRRLQRERAAWAGLQVHHTVVPLLSWEDGSCVLRAKGSVVGSGDGCSVVCRPAAAAHALSSSTCRSPRSFLGWFCPALRAETRRPAQAQVRRRCEASARPLVAARLPAGLPVRAAGRDAALNRPTCLSIRPHRAPGVVR